MPLFHHGGGGGSYGKICLGIGRKNHVKFYVTFSIQFSVRRFEKNYPLGWRAIFHVTLNYRLPFCRPNIQKGLWRDTLLSICGSEGERTRKKLENLSDHMVELYQAAGGVFLLEGGEMSPYGIRHWRNGIMAMGPIEIIAACLLSWIFII